MEELQPQTIKKSSSLAESRPWIIEKSANCGRVAAVEKGKHSRNGMMSQLLEKVKMDKSEMVLQLLESEKGFKLMVLQLHGTG